MESVARREGNALDTLYSEYEGYLPGFVAFTQSALAKRYFSAIEPALRTSVALSSTAPVDFAETEQANYEQRWRGYYGPPFRGAVHVTTVVRTGSAITTRQVIYNSGRASPKQPRSNAINVRTRTTREHTARPAPLP